MSTRVSTFLPELIVDLHNQAVNVASDIEILWLGDNKKRSVGRKRNDLVNIAQGEYVVFVDDDDTIAQTYVEDIYDSLDGSDVIVFDVMYSLNSTKMKKRVIYDYRFSADRNANSAYYRMPNHIMCWKRELMLQAPFMDISLGEDADFAKRINKLATSQRRIDKILYWYDFNQYTTETQQRKRRK